ncbi:hypothetical protein STEG23_032614, partial [Scotinomys teguina]
MSAVMLLPGTNGSLLLVQRTVIRTIVIQETIGKDSLFFSWTTQAKPYRSDYLALKSGEEWIETILLLVDREFNICFTKDECTPYETTAAINLLNLAFPQESSELFHSLGDMCHLVVVPVRLLDKLSSLFSHENHTSTTKKLRLKNAPHPPPRIIRRNKNNFA